MHSNISHRSLRPFGWCFILLSIVLAAGCGGGGGSGGSGGSSGGSSVSLPTNAAPMTDAGPDQVLASGSAVALDGSGSSDPDGDSLTFTWTLTSMPTGSTAVLNDAASAQPTFTADLSGDYVISLVVSDGQASGFSDTVTVTAETQNPAPVADEGAVQNVLTGSLVTLDGSASFDPNGDQITYAWSFVSVPPGSSATLSDVTSVTPNFMPDLSGAYIASLVVNDGTTNSTAATVTVTATIANPAPVADAGDAQNVILGTLVNLDGSASSDSNGDPITYQWVLTSIPVGSAAILSNSSAVYSAFTADLAGDYIASLIVNDGVTDGAADSVTISATASNVAPVADAGSAQNIPTGTLATLDGSSSSDSNGDSLVFAWSFTSVPVASTTSLIGANTPTPQFTVDVDGAYVVSLIVGDGQDSSSPDSVVITATSANSTPVADAGPSQNVVTGVPTTLDGTGSFDADSDPLTYLWSIASAPSGSALSGQTATGPVISMTGDVDGTYVISLVVNDGQASSAASRATITATTSNATPIAFAGPNQTVSELTTVTLNGTGSSDANSDPLTYSWSLISQPAGSGSIVLNNPTSSTPSFVPPIAGSYIVALVVNDGTINSAAHTVVITAISTAPSFVYHYLYGGSGNSVYLGCLNCNFSSTESVCNQFGSYGSEYSASSIWQPYATYGNRYSNFSPWNSLSSSGPAIFGSNGVFYGYFTTNIFRFNRTVISGYVSILNDFSTTGDLPATRAFACGT
jgi:hypothetical protein